MRMCSFSETVGKHERHIEPHFSHQLCIILSEARAFNIEEKKQHLQCLLVIIFTFPAKTAEKCYGFTVVNMNTRHLMKSLLKATPGTCSARVN